METSTTPAPTTPLGARTPLAHPGLYAVIGVLSLVIVVGAVWVFWPEQGSAPTPAEPPSSFEYRVNEYGLSVKLPETWRGFRDVTPGMEWTAYQTSDGRAIDTGPIITLQHPEWTQEVPSQDIPIMVFTIDQWRYVGSTDGDWSVSAAPIPPTELARNSRYVFALPARYNYAFPPGWEEVDELIQAGAVSAYEPAAPAVSPKAYRPLEYSNPTYGFALTFNEAWDGFKVIDETNDDGSHTVWFEIPTSDPAYSGSQLAGYVGVLSITVSTPQQYAELAKACAASPCEPRKLAETSARVYSTSGGMQDVPSDWNFAISAQEALLTFRLLP